MRVACASLLVLLLGACGQLQDCFAASYARADQERSDDAHLDAGLRDIIRQELPALDSVLKHDPLRASELLTHWAATVVDRPAASLPSFVAIGEEVLQMSPGQMYHEVWMKHLVGPSCHAYAAFLQKVLALFGIESFVVDAGIPPFHTDSGKLQSNFTHVTTIVPIREDAEPRFYVFDATFGGTYRTAEGSYADLEAVLSGRVTATFDAIPVYRTVVYPNHEDELYRRYFAKNGLSPSCTTFPNADYARCAEVPYRMDSIHAAWRALPGGEALEGDGDLLRLLLRQNIFSVTANGGTDAKAQFLAMMERASSR